MAGRRIANEVERTIYVIAGLPIALRGVFTPAISAGEEIRRVFAREFWRPRSVSQAGELIAGIILAPIAVPLAALWFTARNGPVIRNREGKGLFAQFIEQLRLYVSAGVFGPWYYILSLYRDGARRAPTFLQRCETKRGIYALLKDEHASPLGDKQAFADRCGAAGIRCAGCETVIDRRKVGPVSLPSGDLFIKPLTGCGGKGAERWDAAGPHRWSDGERNLGEQELLAHLLAKGGRLLVQKRIRTHPALEALTSGAVPTVRALTILDERRRPELVGTVFRMSLGANRTVDNIHAGGLACAASLSDGVLGIASDLGSDARLGWHSSHPTTHAAIEGTRLPYWKQVRALAIAAHEAFADRVVIGWDIAIANDGPIVIEGNRGPDMDLMQRFMELGFCHQHRFSVLIAHHLRERGYGSPRQVNVRDGSQAKAASAASASKAAW